MLQPLSHTFKVSQARDGGPDFLVNTNNLKPEFHSGFLPKRLRLVGSYERYGLCYLFEVWIGAFHLYKVDTVLRPSR